MAIMQAMKRLRPEPRLRGTGVSAFTSPTRPDWSNSTHNPNGIIVYTGGMDTANLIALIDAEIATLRQARALIAGASAEPEKRKPGRPKSAPAPGAPAKKKKRNLSPEGRKRIQEAVKRRWAAAKKAAK